MKLDLGDYLFVWPRLGRHLGEHLLAIVSVNAVAQIGDDLGGPSVGSCRLCLLDEIQEQRWHSS